MAIPTLYEIITLIIAAIVIGTLSYKLGRVGEKAANKLPPGSSGEQKIMAAFEAIVKYLKNNPNMDREFIKELIVVLNIVGTIFSLDVQPLIDDLNSILSSMEPSGSQSTASQPVKSTKDKNN